MLFKSFFRRLLTASLILYTLFMGLIIVLRYFILPNIGEYRPYLEEQLGRATGIPIQIGDIQASWHGLHPHFEVDHLRLSNSNNETVLDIPSVSATLSWVSLIEFSPRFKQIYIQAPEISVSRDQQGGWWVAGQSVSTDTETNTTPPIVSWLLSQDEIVINGAKLNWLDDYRGAPLLELDHVSAVLTQRGLTHRFAIQASPPKGMSTQLDLRAKFQRPIYDFRKTQFDAWTGTIYARLDGFAADHWTPWADIPEEMQTTVGAVRTWVDVSHFKVTQVTTDLDVQNTALRLAPNLEPLRLTQVGGRLTLRPFNAGYQLDTEGLQMTFLDHFIFSPNKLSLAWSPATSTLDEMGRVKVDHLTLDTIAYVVNKLPELGDVREHLAEAKPTGEVSEFSLDWTGAFTEPKDANLAFSFNNVSAEPAVYHGDFKVSAPVRPGVKNLSGHVKLGMSQGEVILDSTNAELFLPGIFEFSELPFDQLKASVRYQRSSDGLYHADINQLYLQHPKFQATIQGRWDADPSTEAGRVDIHGRLDEVHATQIPKMLPLEVGFETREWLNRGIVSGMALDGKFTLKGDLASFPFGTDYPNGEFDISANLKDVSIDYSPPNLDKPWPKLEHINGRLRMHNTAISIEADNAKIWVDKTRYVTVLPTKADIADVEHHALLNIQGAIQGKGNDIVDRVRETPLHNIGGGLLDSLRVSGLVNVPLDINVPLTGPTDVKLRGDIELKQNTVSLLPNLPELVGVTGKLSFTDEKLTIPLLQGSMLNGPFVVKDVPRTGRDSEMRVTGRVDGAALADILGMQAGQLSGQTAYGITLVIEGGARLHTELDADLKGLGIHLPYPLQKEAEQSLPLSGQFDVEKRQHHLSISLKDLAQLELYRKRASDVEPLRIVSGSLGIGANVKAPVVPDQGFALQGVLDHIDLEAWHTSIFNMPIISSADQVPTHAPPVLDLCGLGTKFELTSPELTAIRRFDQATVRGGCQQQGQKNQWSFHLNSQQAQGDFSWFPDEGGRYGTIKGQFGHLVIEKTEDVPGTQTTMKDLPSLDISVARFQLFDMSLGQLDLRAQSNIQDKRWTVESLLLKNEGGTLNASGAWSINDTESSRVNLTLDWEIANAGDLLNAFGIKEALKGGAGHLAGNISWQGVPTSLDKQSLSGDLTLSLDKGQFLKADSKAARLLGVISMQTLPRRMSLDFTDVFSSGFAFDTIHATARLNNGVMKTHDFKMQGIGATVLMDGSVNVSDETQDLHVIIVPIFDAGMASLAYGLAINPAIGLGTFVAQYLLSEPLSKAFTMELQVRGSWDNPDISSLSSKLLNGLSTNTTP